MLIDDSCNDQNVGMCDPLQLLHQNQFFLKITHVGENLTEKRSHLIGNWKHPLEPCLFVYLSMYINIWGTLFGIIRTPLLFAWFALVFFSLFLQHYSRGANCWCKVSKSARRGWWETYLSIYLYVCMSICLSIYMYVCMFAYLFIPMYIYERHFSISDKLL